jgi:hypothetical protein
METSTNHSYLQHTTQSTLNSVWDRYTMDQLYFMHRPSISIVDRYLTPIWYVVGFPGNLMAFIIWVQPKMRPSSGCYLAALAMTDFIFLILQLLFELQNTWNIRILMVPVLCETFPIFFLASQYLSPLLVLGFTMERYVAICHPFQRDKFCSTSKAIRCIICLVIISLLLHAIQGYFWKYYPENNDCGLRQEVMAGGSKSLWSVWSWITELLVFGLVPIGILVLNLCVIRETRKLRNAEEKLLCLKRGEHKSSTGASATTFMLLAVSFYLIFTTLPVTVLYAMGLSFPEGEDIMTDEDIFEDPVWQRHFTYYTLRTIVQELGMSHYAGNFYIYLMTGKVFRKELHRIFYKFFCQGISERFWHSELEDFGSSFVSRKSKSTNVTYV